MSDEDSSMASFRQLHLRNAPGRLADRWLTHVRVAEDKPKDTEEEDEEPSDEEKQQPAWDQFMKEEGDKETVNPDTGNKTKIRSLRGEKGREKRKQLYQQWAQKRQDQGGDGDKGKSDAPDAAGAVDQDPDIDKPIENFDPKKHKPPADGMPAKDGVVKDVQDKASKGVAPTKREVSNALMLVTKAVVFKDDLSDAEKDKLHSTENWLRDMAGELEGERVEDKRQKRLREQEDKDSKQRKAPRLPELPKETSKALTDVGIDVTDEDDMSDLMRAVGMVSSKDPAEARDEIAESLEEGGLDELAAKVRKMDDENSKHLLEVRRKQPRKKKDKEDGKSEGGDEPTDDKGGKAKEPTDEPKPGKKPAKTDEQPEGEAEKPAKSTKKRPQTEDEFFEDMGADWDPGDKTTAEVKREFLEFVEDPEERKRIEEMSDEEFEQMMLKKMQGKSASLRSKAVRLAYLRPDLRGSLLHLLQHTTGWWR